MYLIIYKTKRSWFACAMMYKDKAEAEGLAVTMSERHGMKFKVVFVELPE